MGGVKGKGGNSASVAKGAVKKRHLKDDLDQLNNFVNTIQVREEKVLQENKRLKRENEHFFKVYGPKIGEQTGLDWLGTDSTRESEVVKGLHAELDAAKHKITTLENEIRVLGEKRFVKLPQEKLIKLGLELWKRGEDNYLGMSYKQCMDRLSERKQDVRYDEDLLDGAEHGAEAKLAVAEAQFEIRQGILQNIQAKSEAVGPYLKHLDKLASEMKLKVMDRENDYEELAKRFPTGAKADDGDQEEEHEVEDEEQDTVVE